jgi:hypothetical protein
MWNLPAPSEAFDDDLQRAMRRANGTSVYAVSEAQRNALRALYRRYHARRGRVHAEFLAPTLSVAFQTALYNAFAEVQVGRRLQHIRDQLKLAAIRCPLCGFAPVTDLDHHLPRGTYRALSIHRRNLVPVCGTCNNKKRAVGAAVSKEQFIHPYLERLPNRRFFHARAVMIGRALVVRFSIQRTFGLTAPLFGRLKRQIERLELESRYASEINVFVVGLQDGLKLAYGNGGGNLPRVRRYLRDTAATHKRNFGKNDWRYALLMALLECDAFCGGGFALIGVR